MSNISFVILHYNTIGETRNCVKSILKLQDELSFNIIIIDNASPNGSGEILKNE